MILGNSLRDMSELSDLNSTVSPLLGNATFLGTWEDISMYSCITIAGLSDVSGTLYFDFSIDGATILESIQLSNGDNGDFGTHGLIPLTRYGRVRLENGSSPQSTLALQTIFHVNSKLALKTSNGSFMKSAMVSHNF